MKILDLKEKNILVLGYAREGASVVSFLRKYFPTKRIDVWEQAREVTRGYDKNTTVQVNVGDWRKISGWDKYDLIIKSAGIPLKNLPEEICDRLSSETQLFFDFCPGKIIGITGTKGKSTTSSLIYEMLIAGGKKALLLGNIGSPALDYLDKGDKETWFVFELSSHQLQTIAKSPHIAVVLNLYPEHLDFYRDFPDYVQAKARITRLQKENDYLVFNEDDPLVVGITKASGAKKIPFGSKDLEECRRLASGSKLQGDFNLFNLAAASAVARVVGISEKIVKQAVRSFQPLEHRLERVGTFKGITFYNDSLATIPEATIAALDTLGDEVETIFLGGFDRGIDYSNLSKRLFESKISLIILFPTTGKRIWQNLIDIDSNAQERFQHYFIDNMEEGVKLAYKHTNKGKICLLSCASTSFGLFRDYQDRGRQFKELVRKLGR